MTDKATIELTSPVDGVISMVACEEGEVLAVGADLVVLTVEGEGNVDAAPEATPQPPIAPTKAPLKPKTSKSKPISKPAPKASGKALASPAVRKRAKAAGLDLTQANASGKDGQVTHADLDLLEKSFVLQDDETRIKVIGLRRVIAQRMQESKRHIPHFTYVEEIDVTALEALRKRANNKKSEDKPKLTVLPFIIRALASTLEDWPQFNARYMDAVSYTHLTLPTIPLV